jgi:polysaccharide pyruvyl transferase WcaK-like protein
MKILHLASFLGNIGDNASHIGFYNVLNQIIKDIEQIDKLEIRNFYRNSPSEYRKYFDISFVEKLNNYDLVIIGGGGFLDYWVPESATGTTIDISLKILDAIKTPILFTSVGCVPNKTVPKGNKQKFKCFLNYIIQSKRISLLLRNDGSVQNIEKEFGLDVSSQLPTILDNGFHYSPQKKFLFPIRNKYVVINVSHDQVEMAGPEAVCQSESSYYKELIKTIEHIINNRGLDVCLIPHILQDLNAINSIIELLDERLIRNHITVAPCIQGDDGADFIFSIYKGSELVIGTRYHANVCSVAMGKKSIGLVALNRVMYMYDSIDMKGAYVMISDGFSAQLCKKIDRLISTGSSVYKDTVMSKFKDKKAQSLSTYRSTIYELMKI